MKIFSAILAVLCFSVCGAYCDWLLLVDGGKLECRIVSQTPKHYIVTDGAKHVKIDKNEVVYSISSIEISAEENIKKASILPYVCPLNKTVEVGLCLIF